MPKAKITKSFVDQTAFTEKGQALYCDKDLPGFYLVVGKRAKTYIVQKDILGRSVRVTIGRHGHFIPEEARKIAKDHLYLMAQGINPNKLEEKQREGVVTLQQVLESYTMRDFLMFLLFTGLRRNEAASLNWSDVDFEE